MIKNSYNYLLILLFILPISALSQQDKTGTWLMYFGTNKISDKLSIHSEFQYRNHTFGSINTEQLLIRVGLNYHFSEKAFVTGGYAFVPSYEFESEQKNPETTEHRIWQQFILINKIGRVKFEHRYRIEQRWVNDDYKNRFRYRLMLFVPINKPVIEKGSLFVGIYDEIFINAESTFFDRNRLYGALGYQFNKSTNLQIGMMNQQVTDFGKWYFQVAIFFNPDLRKSKS